MNFKLYQDINYTFTVDVIIPSKPESFFLLISLEGLTRFETSNPQPGIEYESFMGREMGHAPIIEGVDVV